MELLSSLQETFTDASTLNGWLTPDRILGIISGLCVLAGATVAAPMLGRSIVRLAGKRWNAQQIAICRRVINYVVYAAATVAALNQLGFDLKILLGSAGVLAFAVTYSSQKSLSQVITGLFIIIEQPFVIGDTITVAGITGEVLSIDLLSPARCCSTALSPTPRTTPSAA
jgi:small-conductance mechanosensitive channel